MNDLIETLLKKEETLKASNRFNKRPYWHGLRYFSLFLCLLLVSFSGCAKKSYESSPDFRPTKGEMLIPRYGHKAVLLKDGKVLILGGYTPKKNIGAVPTLEAEIYDPKTEHFSPAGKMHFFHETGTVSLLKDGKILIIGGRDKKPHNCPYGFNTVEIYNPQTKQFYSTGKMIVPRLGHTATILPDGKVLVTGGIKYVCLRKGKNISDVGDFLKSQEIYDPETGKFQLTKSLLVGHSISQTLQISQAEIFIIGSATDSLNSLRDPSKDSEIYNFITKKSKFVNNNSFNSKYVPAYYISPDKTLTYSIENPSGKNIGHYIHFYLFNQKTEKVEKQIRIYIPAKNYFTMDIGMFPDNNRLFCFLVSNRGFLRSLEPNYAFIYNIKENKYIPVGWFPDKSFNGYSMTPLSNGKQVLITGGVYWSQMRGLTKHSAWLYDPIKQGAVK